MNHAIALAGALIGAGIALGGGAIGAAIGDGLAGNAAIQGQARQPEAAGALRVTMFLIIGLVEAMYFINLVFVFILIGDAKIPADLMGPMVADASLLEINVTFVVEVIAFVAMLLILGRWVYPRVMAAAEARQNQIARALSEAERSRQDAAAALEDVSRQIDEARAQAREIIDRAHKAAVTETEELVRKGRRDAEAQIQRARSDIATERDKAIQEIRAQVGTLVVSAASKVLGESIDSRTHSRLIEESLAQVDSGRGAGAN